MRMKNACTVVHIYIYTIDVIVENVELSEENSEASWFDPI